MRPTYSSKSFLRSNARKSPSYANGSRPASCFLTCMDHFAPVTSSKPFGCTKVNTGPGSWKRPTRLSTHTIGRRELRPKPGTSRSNLYWQARRNFKQWVYGRRTRHRKHLHRLHQHWSRVVRQRTNQSQRHPDLHPPHNGCLRWLNAGNEARL